MPWSCCLCIRNGLSRLFMNTRNEGRKNVNLRCASPGVRFRRSEVRTYVPSILSAVPTKKHNFINGISFIQQVRYGFRQLFGKYPQRLFTNRINYSGMAESEELPEAVSNTNQKVSEAISYRLPKPNAFILEAAASSVRCQTKRTSTRNIT